MSHELRTPMTSILGFGQLLVDECDGLAREMAEHVVNGANQLSALINDLVDISRIESEQMDIPIERVCLADAVTQTVSMIEPEASARGLAVELGSTVPAGLAIAADPQRLRQILLNLLTNATKYNRDGGRIRVNLTRSGDRARVEVRDDGPGLTDEQRARLFVPFDRLGAERTPVKGTGLGLVIARGLAEAMGGALGVDSRPGEGTSAWTTWPILDEPFVARSATANETTRGVSELAGTVLYLEDDPATVACVRALLTRRPGVSLMVADTGVKGLQLARESRPDLVLLDLTLADMPGELVLQRLRRQPETAAVPVAVVTADADVDRRGKLTRAGAHAYLTKPFEIDELLAVIDDALVKGDRHPAAAMAGRGPTR
jgi:CheY-like chemotaxis protein